MGIIKAAIGSVGGVLADQWKDFFSCDALSADVLAAKGQKRVSRRSSNTRGEDNIITAGSGIAVADGQCMIIVDQGKVADVCAEPGEYIYDASSEPALFCGDLRAGIDASLKNIKARFAMGGSPGKDQRVYYFNMKEIIGNKYGTPNPLPFRVVDANIGLDIDIAIRLHGEYSYKLVDPILFYTNVCGNVEHTYHRGQLDSMLKTELLTALQPAFAKVSELGIRYSALPGHTAEFAQALNEVLSPKWTQLRGIAIASIGVNSVSASEEDENMIKQLQKSAVMRDPGMAAAALVGAQADAMRAAAANKQGAMTGFMGLGLAQQAGGANAGEMFALQQKQQQRQQQQQQQQQSRQAAGPGTAEARSWTCACGVSNSGNFCADCGKPRPAANVRCDKCGWTPEPGGKPPKFCPECGDPF
ncbi:MAG: SPFH domain-containing protein [Gracilibacteraceae bacterium]|jgi:membrane protease subunit (stomatin/prohibitin family)|nr:SPFH domain-containing protein [Gracilibacteraceae bacterium]